MYLCIYLPSLSIYSLIYLCIYPSIYLCNYVSISGLLTFTFNQGVGGLWWGLCIGLLVTSTTGGCYLRYLDYEEEASLAQQRVGCDRDIEGGNDSGVDMASGMGMGMGIGMGKGSGVDEEIDMDMGIGIGMGVGANTLSNGGDSGGSYGQIEVRSEKGLYDGTSGYNGTKVDRKVDKKIDRKQTPGTVYNVLQVYSGSKDV